VANIVNFFPDSFYCSRTSVFGQRYIVWKPIDATAEVGEKLCQTLAEMTAPYRR
jgi:hypothetical protein